MPSSKHFICTSSVTSHSHLRVCTFSLPFYLYKNWGTEEFAQVRLGRESRAELGFWPKVAPPLLILTTIPCRSFTVGERGPILLCSSRCHVMVHRGSPAPWGYLTRLGCVMDQQHVQFPLPQWKWGQGTGRQWPVLIVGGGREESGKISWRRWPLNWGSQWQNPEWWFKKLRYGFHL